METIDKQKYIFGLIFALTNKFQAIGDQYLGIDDMTIRQWFLTICIAQFQDAPTLGEVAQFMSSSHQNVKQLALKLEKKEFVRIYKDVKDARILRLSLTPRCTAFWEDREGKDNEFIKTFFQDVGDDELNALYKVLNKLTERAFKIEKSYSK